MENKIWQQLKRINKRRHLLPGGGAHIHQTCSRFLTILKGSRPSSVLVSSMTSTTGFKSSRSMWEFCPELRADLSETLPHLDLDCFHLLLINNSGLSGSTRQRRWTLGPFTSVLELNVGFKLNTCMFSCWLQNK